MSKLSSRFQVCCLFLSFVSLSMRFHEVTRGLLLDMVYTICSGLWEGEGMEQALTI